MTIARPPEERFWSHVVKLSCECWFWAAGISKNGYGVFDGHFSAHKFAYELVKGKVPDGLQLDHKCHNRFCVNPDHLEPVTASENVKRGLLPELTRQMMLSKTHCPQGHPYDLFNTTFYHGRRYCKTCNNERQFIKHRAERTKQ